MRADIENTIYQYNWAYDMGQIDAIGACFAEHAEFAFDNGTQFGRDAIVAELRRRRTRFQADEVPWHMVTNVLVDQVSDSRALVISRFTLAIRDPEGNVRLDRLGYYDDVLDAIDSRWQITRRRVLRPGSPESSTPPFWGVALSA